MTEPLSLLTAFLLGVFGSSHCVVMCGGISAAIGARAGEHRIRASLLFNSGRIFSYAIAGLIVSFAGLWLAQQNHILMLVLRSVAAIMLILMGLYVARWSMLLTRFEQVGNLLWKRLQPLTVRFMQSEKSSDQLLLGMLWGWLPCGLVYSTLSWVAANGDPLMGPLSMLAFGAGTLPALFATTLAGSMISGLSANTHVRRFAGLMLIVYGLWTGWSVWFQH
ncbi:MAG: cytochrome biogenesis protein [Oceanospirillaceae bacterium]|uniref:sulfite exporter TauE/SafE family protein n=1 Tax=unclassified Thalassolituus TaxID=2624967 RepID=UPI000C3517C4|nr:MULTISPECIES: sulfite exporter TauE/SafE family protein [unclassified Thalassolituus]MAS23878.1 cytochrome biogenesis protein [Oceanospirillaceae bacterium]MAX98236.1 cytochrome biogenesis protein [Oceanospirillaceae bacterium]MBS53601.1 cytochrome biogenesis protein [Oceanospirillaceae bacterium]|tara:strand:+ start:1358 stop:2020 length:663 start_codon:yes stop_codon:yes gene_type:complete